MREKIGVFCAFAGLACMLSMLLLFFGPKVPEKLIGTVAFSGFGFIGAAIIIGLTSDNADFRKSLKAAAKLLNVSFNDKGNDYSFSGQYQGTFINIRDTSFGSNFSPGKFAAISASVSKPAKDNEIVYPTRMTVLRGDTISYKGGLSSFPREGEWRKIFDELHMAKQLVESGAQPLKVKRFPFSLDKLATMGFYLIVGLGLLAAFFVDKRVFWTYLGVSILVGMVVLNVWWREKRERSPGGLYAAEMLFADGKSKEAAAELTRIISKKPKRSEAYIVRAEVYEELGDLQAALSDYTKVLELDAGNRDALYGRAMLFMKMNDPKRAREDFEKAKGFIRGIDPEFAAEMDKLKETA